MCLWVGGVDLTCCVLRMCAHSLFHTLIIPPSHPITHQAAVREGALKLEAAGREQQALQSALDGTRQQLGEAQGQVAALQQQLQTLKDEQVCDRFVCDISV